MAEYCTHVLYFHSPAARENTAAHFSHIAFSAILPSQPYCLLSHQIIYMYRGSGGVPQEKFGILNSDFDAIQEVKSHIFKLPLPKTPAPPHQKKIKGLTKIFVKSFPSKTSLD